MVAKKAILFILLCTINYSYNAPLATGIIMDSIEFTARTKKLCTGTPAQERHSLFTQAEQHEQAFIDAYNQCRQENNCDTHQLFQELKSHVEKSILDLSNHLETLETTNDGRCHACEKTEAKDIKNRLLALLKAASDPHS